VTRAGGLEANNAYRRELNAKHRAAVVAKYGGACACCGFADSRALALDHVNGDGAAHRAAVSTGRARRSNGGITWYARLNREPRDPDLQLLCYNCNAAKGTGPRCPLDHERWLPTPT
jgi:hypothetical protein